jgi:integrase
LGVVTLNERLAKIKSLYKLVKAKGTLSVNPAVDTIGLKQNSFAKREKRRLPFDHSDLTNIFSSAVFNEEQLRSEGQSGEATYWIPLLMYYTGARTEEIAGLALADVVQDPELGWYFNIIDRPSPEDEGLYDDDELIGDNLKSKAKSKSASEPQPHTRTLKNSTSIRKVPLAAELIELGLFRYMDWVRATGSASLFPTLNHDWHNKLSGAFSKFFGRYKK